jgi:MoaA/NifB/PqqE/SkfB family radical SAM enzyme
MECTGLHFLLTYQCNFECEHCFVWSSPRQKGTFQIRQIQELLDQARRLGSVGSIYFEGGEPFLYYPVLLAGVRAAADLGFEVGLVSNAYWATSIDDALEWLKPFAGLLADLSISSDLFHYDEFTSQQSRNAGAAAQALQIPCGVIQIDPPDQAQASEGVIPAGESAVMYRGRAAAVLADGAPHKAWDAFNNCPHEDLAEPGRLHVDPLGYLHICQGITIGNVFEQALAEICDSYDPYGHPICGPLLRGGPVELVKTYQLAHQDAYADACHLCYSSRLLLRERFPAILGPDQVYGLVG